MVPAGGPAGRPPAAAEPAEGRFGVSASESGRQRPHCAVGWLGGEYLGHVGVDRLLAGRGGYRYPVMPVADEMLAAHAVHLDRRVPPPPPPCQRPLLPPVLHPSLGGSPVSVSILALVLPAARLVQPCLPLF